MIVSLLLQDHTSETTGNWLPEEEQIYIYMHCLMVAQLLSYLKHNSDDVVKSSWNSIALMMVTI